MENRKPYYTRSQRLFRAVSWCSMLMTTAVVLMPPSLKPFQPKARHSSFAGHHRFLPSFFSQEAASTGEEGVLPVVLSNKDRSHYKAIFDAQKKGDFTTADALIGDLDNDVLLGTVLAERYAGPHHRTTVGELASWLQHYSDHPQAAAFYERVLAHEPSLRDELPYISKAAQLSAHGDQFGMSSHAYQNAYQGSWQAGLSAWKYGRKAEAAKHFTSISAHEKEISPWMAAAAAYWSYRAHNANGNNSVAQDYLKKAAAYPRTFYGVIARKQLGEPLGLDVQPVQLTESDVLTMVGDQSVRRIIALSELHMNELAEKELRSRFPQAEEQEKNRLLALAHELGLAAVQISMAHELGLEGRELDFARYPVPNLQPHGGYRVDPLLIFALMRQESGFRPTAVSPVGALGLMQLMPQTASLMHKQMYGTKEPPVIQSVAEPVMNVTLGQNYVETLLTNPLVEGNLFYLLAAYNAGPGRLQEWKGSLGAKNDPLLFVESIPFNETRSYVMQVMTNYWMYSELIGGNDRSVYALLEGKWPTYAQYERVVAEGESASPLETAPASLPGGA